MINPKDHWENKAKELKNERKFEEAVEILDKVETLKKDEKADDFWYKKAIQFVELGEYDQGIDALHKDLEITKNRYDSLFLLGKIFYELRNYEESLECFNKSSEEHSSEHLKNTQKIDQMKNVHKFEEAVKYSDLVYQEKILDSDYWYHKGLVLFKLKKFNESSSCFKISLDTDPNNSKILYSFAKSELHAGNMSHSFELLEKSCLINPQNVDLLRIDSDFERISEEKQFRMITGLSELK